MTERELEVIRSLTPAMKEYIRAEMKTAGEVTKECLVEAVGTITWPEPDDKWNSPEPCARVVVEGYRHYVTSSQCFRNGTVIVPKIVGMRGTVGVFNSSVVWFNLPTLFSRGQ